MKKLKKRKKEKKEENGREPLTPVHNFWVTVCCAVSSIPPMKKTVDGVHRWWTRTGTQAAKRFTWASRERNGKSCTASSWTQNGAVNVRHPNGNHRANTLWKVGEAKEKGDACYDQDREERMAGTVGTNTCRIRRWLWMKPCEEWPWGDRADSSTAEGSRS